MLTCLCACRDLLAAQDDKAAASMAWMRKLKRSGHIMQRWQLKEARQCMHIIMSMLCSGAAGLPAQRGATLVLLQIDRGQQGLVCGCSGCQKGPACQGNRIVLKEGSMQVVMEHHKTQLTAKAVAYSWDLQPASPWYQLLRMYAEDVQPQMMRLLDVSQPYLCMKPEGQPMTVEYFRGWVPHRRGGGVGKGGWGDHVLTPLPACCLQHLPFFMWQLLHAGA